MEHALWIAAGLLALTAPLAGQSKESLVAAELLADTATVQPGGTFRVGARFRIEPGWHIYWINPGDAGQATTVQLKAPPGFVVGPWQYPVPQRFEQPGQITGYGYSDTVLLIAEVKAPADLPVRQPIRLEGRATWLVCKDVCVPGRANLRLVLNTDDTGQPADAETFDTWQDRLPVPADAASTPVADVKVIGTAPPREHRGGNSSVPRPLLLVTTGIVLAGFGDPASHHRLRRRAGEGLEVAGQHLFEHFDGQRQAVQLDPAV